MKKFKLLSLVLAVLMLSTCICFASCQGAVEKVTINVKVTIKDNEGNVLLGPVDTVAIGDVENLPTVKDAVVNALIENEYKYELTVDEMGFDSIGDFVDKVEGEYTYFWEYSVDGVVPTSGRAGTNLAVEGSSIEYYYVKILTSDLIAAEGK